MDSYIFDKRIDLPEVPDKVSNVSLQSDFDYIKLENGLHVMGKVAISGECRCSEHNVPFLDYLDVDLIIPNDNLDNLKDLKMVVDDYETHIVDESVNFKIKCSLNGYDEAKDNFEINESFKEVLEKLEVVDKKDLNKKLRELLTHDDEIKLEDMIKSDVEVFISEPIEEEKSQEDEFINQEQSEKNDESVKEEKDEAVHPYQEIILDPVPVISEKSNNDEVIAAKMNDAKTQDDVHTTAFQKNAEKQTLFQDRFVVFSRFYRVKKGDTYESIALNNNVDVSILKAINHSKELTEGNLIQIPR